MRCLGRDHRQPRQTGAGRLVLDRALLAGGRHVDRASEFEHCGGDEALRPSAPRRSSAERGHAGGGTQEHAQHIGDVTSRNAGSRTWQASEETRACQKALKLMLRQSAWDQADSDHAITAATCLRPQHHQGVICTRPHRGRLHGTRTTELPPAVEEPSESLRCSPIERRADQWKSRLDVFKAPNSRE